MEAGVGWIQRGAWERTTNGGVDTRKQRAAGSGDCNQHWMRPCDQIVQRGAHKQLRIDIEATLSSQRCGDCKWRKDGCSGKKRLERR